MSFHQSLAHRIHKLRLRHKLTPAECANLAGMSLRAYRRLEEGLTRRVKLSTAERLADVFGLPLWELLKGVK